MDAQYETQLKYRRLDDGDDMLFGANGTGFLEGLPAMRQVLQTRLRAIAGEWWEGDDGALPYMTEYVGAIPTQAKRNALDLMVVERILDTRGVISVDNIKSGYSNRHYHFTCDVSTVYGTTQAEVST